jgi:hypothetical protein
VGLLVVVEEAVNDCRDRVLDSGRGVGQGQDRHDEVDNVHSYGTVSQRKTVASSQGHVGSVEGVTTVR